MSLTTTLTDSTFYRNHAVDNFGFTEENGILSTGRSFFGGTNQTIKVPSSYSWMIYPNPVTLSNQIGKPS